MDFDKLKQWMEVTQKYQNGKFWDMVFEQAAQEETIDGFENPQESKKSTRTMLNKYPVTDIFLY